MSVDRTQGQKLFLLESGTQIINSTNWLFISKSLSGFGFIVTVRFLPFSGPHLNTFTGDVQRVQVVLVGISRHGLGRDDCPRTKSLSWTGIEREEEVVHQFSLGEEEE
jgi:hypothetical protein